MISSGLSDGDTHIDAPPSLARMYIAIKHSFFKKDYKTHFPLYLMFVMRVFFYLSAISPYAFANNYQDIVYIN